MSQSLFPTDTYNYFNLGTLLNWGLHGALCAQVYLYYLAFPEDRTLNKALVYGVFILESVQVILLLIDGMYTYRPFVVLSHGPGIQPMQFVVQPSKVTMIIWTSIPVLGTTVTFVVQLFYAYRLRRLAHSWVLAMFVGLLAFFQAVVTLVAGTQLLTNRGMIQPIYKPGSQILWAVSSIICDIVIAVAMTYWLLHNDNGWKSTHTLLMKLVCLAVETGTITVVVSVFYLILLIQDETTRSTVFMIPVFVLGKVYSNTMMANLNHRIQIYNGRNDAQSISFTIPMTDPEIRENPSRVG